MYADNVKIKPNEIIYMNLEMHFTLISLTRSILNNKNCRSKCKENWQTNEWDNEWKWYSHLSQLKMHLAHAITHIHRIASQNQSIAVWFCVLISFYLFVRMKKKKREEKTRQFVFTICMHHVLSYRTSARVNGKFCVPLAKMRIRRLGNHIHSANIYHFMWT